MCNDRIHSRDRGFHRDFDRDGGHEHGRNCRTHNENVYRPSNMTAPFPRRFISNAEFLEFLNTYLKEVEQEAQGVREAIAELETEMADKSETEE